MFGALVISGAAASPGNEILGCRKYGHIAADFRKDQDCSHAMAYGGGWTVVNYKTEDDNEAGCWWLRSPGSYQYYAAFVSYDGSLDCTEVGVRRFVRPALWINLESDIF